MTCAKKTITCDIVTPDGRVYFGSNACIVPQTTCPRLPGDDYAKCLSVCMQPAHAEVAAIRAADGDSLVGATAIVRGAYHVCKPCASALRDAGVARIIIEVTQP